LHISLLVSDNVCKEPGFMRRLNRAFMTFLAAVFLATAAGILSGDEPVTATGRVVDGDGKPVEHATVLVYEAGVKKGYSVFCPTCYTDCGKRSSTDTDGNFAIGGLNGDLLFTFLVVRDGYSAAYLRKVDPAKGLTESPVLKPHPSIEDPPN
jgi:hypothetical protein